MLIAFIACVGLMMFFGCGQGGTKSVVKEYSTLSLQIINVDPFSNLPSLLSLTDEKGVKITVTDLDKWFENVKVKNVTFPKDATMDYIPVQFGTGGHFILSDNSKMQCDFDVEEKTYTLSINKGTEFFTEKTVEGKYILLLDETVKLSSPPEITEK